MRRIQSVWWQVLRKIFGPSQDDVAGGQRKLLHNLYPSPNNLRMIKWRMRGVGNVFAWERWWRSSCRWYLRIHASQSLVPILSQTSPFHSILCINTVFVTDLVWLRIGINSWLLWRCKWSLGFYKRVGIYYLASKEGLCPI